MMTTIRREAENHRRERVTVLYRDIRNVVTAWITREPQTFSPRFLVVACIMTSAWATPGFFCFGVKEAWNVRSKSGADWWAHAHSDRDDVGGGMLRQWGPFHVVPRAPAENSAPERIWLCAGWPGRVRTW